LSHIRVLRSPSPTLRRPGLPREHREQREVRLIEGQPGLEQMLGKPLARALGERLGRVAGDRRLAIDEAGEEHVGRHADHQLAAKVGIGSEVFEHRQGRGALERELDRAPPGDLFPHRQLQPEQHPRRTRDDQRIAFAAVDAAALPGPQAFAVANRRLRTEGPPVRLPGAERGDEGEHGQHRAGADAQRRQRARVSGGRAGFRTGSR
jgi:hypothetical protein